MKKKFSPYTKPTTKSVPSKEQFTKQKQKDQPPITRSKTPVVLKKANRTKSAHSANRHLSKSPFKDLSPMKATSNKECSYFEKKTSTNESILSPFPDNKAIKFETIGEEPEFPKTTTTKAKPSSKVKALNAKDNIPKKKKMTKGNSEVPCSNKNNLFSVPVLPQVKRYNVLFIFDHNLGHVKRKLANTSLAINENTFQYIYPKEGESEIDQSDKLHKYDRIFLFLNYSPCLKKKSLETSASLVSQIGKFFLEELLTI